MDRVDENTVEIHEDGEIIEVIDLSDTEQNPDDLADELDDVDFGEDDGGEADNEEGWETEDEMEEQKDDSELTFSRHSGSVFCVSLDPLTSSLAVTGGEDDLAFVWKVDDGEVLIECKGHRDSVTCTSFSHDSSLVATGDMGGLIKVWKVESKEEIWSFEVGDLEWLQWHPAAPVLLAGAADGNVWMWKIPAGDCKTLQGPGCQATSGKVLPDGKRAVVGYFDGTVRLWDLKTGSALHVLKGQDGHRGALTSLACSLDGSLLLTGSVDGRAKLLNTATGKVLGVFSAEGGGGAKSLKDDAGEEAEPNSVESVGFCNVLPLAAVGYLDGTLDIYDLSCQTRRHRCQHQAGIVHLQWEQSSSVVWTCSLDGAVRVWDARSGVMLSELLGHRAEVLHFTINREGSLAVTASGDHQAKVFCLQRPDR